MLKLKPVLSTANIGTWPRSFLSLWESTAPWYCLYDMRLPGNPEVVTTTCPVCTSNKPVLNPAETDTLVHQAVRLRRIGFSYPGPCGTTLHYLVVGACDECQSVHWIPSFMDCHTWTLEQIKQHAFAAAIREKNHRPV